MIKSETKNGCLTNCLTYPSLSCEITINRLVLTILSMFLSQITHPFDREADRRKELWAAYTAVTAVAITDVSATGAACKHGFYESLSLTTRSASDSFSCGDSSKGVDTTTASAAIAVATAAKRWTGKCELLTR